MAGLYTPESWATVSAIIPVIHGTAWWDRRFEVEWYVHSCERAGFCTTDDLRRACARRFMAGKKKVTPPGTRRKKKAEKERRRLLRALPPELMAAISSAAELPAAQQFTNGNDRALNAVVGAVLRQHRADPSLVRDLLIKRLRPDEPESTPDPLPLERGEGNG